MDNPTQKEKASLDSSSRVPNWRLAVSAAIGILVGLYTVAVIGGLIPADCRIDAAHLALLAAAGLAIALLLRPELLTRLRQVEWGGLKLDLEKVQDAQARQDRELESLKDIIPLLLSDAERKHLLLLKKGEDLNIKADHQLRTELRRLRSVGLIKMRKNPDGRDYYVADLKDREQPYDLATHVELTNRGERWANRISASEADQAQQ